jgi:hypothetical protein
LTDGTANDTSGNNNHGQGFHPARNSVPKPPYTTYLRINGINQAFRTPTGITFNTMEVDCRHYAIEDGATQSPLISTKYDVFGSAEMEFSYKANFQVNDVFNASTWSKDGLVNPNNKFFPQGHRAVIKITRTSTAAGYVAVGTSRAGDGGIGFTRMDIWSVKLYNAGTLVAFYDMSTGTLNNQVAGSSIGAATLVGGGTWITR